MSGSNALRLAEEWRDRVAVVARNLTDFNDSDEATRVKARMADPVDPYAGRTARAATLAAQALDSLWNDYLMVSRVVDEAYDMARRSNILNNVDAAAIAKLNGPSIRLPTISVPVKSRNLLDSAETQGMACPKDVLDSMIRAFGVARDAMTSICEAEDRVGPRASAMSSEARAVADWARGARADVGDLGAQMPSFDDMTRDPLDADARMDAAEAVLQSLRARQRQVEAQDDALRARFAKADRDVVELAAMASRVKAAQAERAERVVGAWPAHDASSDDHGTLSTWLATLRAAAADGRRKATAIGLDKWEEARAARDERLTAAYATARRPLDEMEDMKGRFRALRAKAASREATASVAALEASARDAVAARPFDLDGTSRAVAAYEHGLSTARRIDETGEGRRA